MNAALKAHIGEVLLQQNLPDSAKRNVTAVSGGSINEAWQFRVGDKSYFVKTNDADRYPGMFEREAEGLQLLASTHSFRVPEIIACGEFNGQSYLLLEFLERGKLRRDYWEQAGRNLALLHKHTHTSFGLAHDNYMGSLPQKNAWKDSYVQFLIENRLQPQFEMAAKRYAAVKNMQTQIEKLYQRLPLLIPEEKPSLVHGDLWSGNMIIGPEGEACLIDPAVHYGHREADLAMTKMFGGFEAEFYQAYHAEFPPEKGWEMRAELFNLYPFLIHLNLFGGGYLQSVQHIVSRYS